MLKASVRYVKGLRNFLQEPLSREEAYYQIGHQLEQRQQSFLLMVKRGIYEEPQSPYRRLLHNAGITYEDIASRIQQIGVEPLLGELFDAGVYVTLNEFKSRQPIQRPGFECVTKPSDFDNPLIKQQYEGQTGGTRSKGHRIIIDFDALTHEAAYTHRLLECFKLHDRPHASWRIPPPGVAGIKMMFRCVKNGIHVEKWFTPIRLFQWPDTITRYLKHYAFLYYTLHTSRIMGNPIPTPEYVPYSQAHRIARWLEKQVQHGQPAALDTTPSAAVRICQAALQNRIDIHGTFFQLGGEPLTEGKFNHICQAGCRAVTYYSMAEVGRISTPCPNASCPDDTHLLIDKLAVLQRPTTMEIDSPVDGFYYTTLLLSCPKLMLNVESGDYGNLEKRTCGCLWEKAGFPMHMSNIRSYEKLTTEGMHFLGSEIYFLIENTLPQKYGGCSTNYQLLEREKDGLTRLYIVISPQIGELNEVDVVDTVVEELRKLPGAMAMVTRLLASGNTIQVLRREPYTTRVGKTFPIHIEKRA